MAFQLSTEQVQQLIAVLDNSVISDKAVSKDVYLGLIAFRDQMLYDAGSSIGVDTNDAQQMGQLYRQVEQSLGQVVVTV